MAIVAVSAHAADTANKKDIVDTAIAAEQFETLVSAVKAADLVDVLKGEGPFTVFAPTDKAFEKVPKEKLEALLKDKEALQSVLQYHVVPGKVMAADVVKLKSAKTALGKPVRIAVKDRDVTINGAKVVKTDIECTNGVIHVIDAVLLPPADGAKSAE
ncbi:MAG TPA: fasciclin domain-containing protein [Lacipirellulaceae bacterium]|nr:fasciclin domain-containing protein [Lacipirellulaceae bacterium]